MTRFRFFSWLAAIFGSFGTAICVASLVVVWVLSIQVQGSVSNVFGQVSDLLTRVHDGSAEITVRVETSRESVAELESRIGDGAARVAASVDRDPEEIAAFANEARLIAQRLQDWRAFAESAGDLIELVDGLIRSAVLYFRSDEDSRGPLMASIENGQRQVGEAAAALEDLVAQLEALRESRDQKAYEAAAKPLFVRVDGALALVEEHNEAFAARVSDLEAATTRLGKKIRRRIYFGAVLSSLLLLWLGAGQVCLAKRGISGIRENQKRETQVARNDHVKES